MPRKALYGLVVLILTALGVELSLAAIGRYPPSPRLYPGDKPVGSYEHTDTLIGWKLPPGARIEARPRHGDYEVTYVAGEGGFRSSEEGSPPGDPADGTPENLVDEAPGDSAGVGTRIVFLGDSFTFGVGVEGDETFAHLVSERFGSVPTANYGMSGFGIDQMWLTLRHYASEPPPDIVVVAFVLDDLNRTMSAYRLRDTLQTLRSQGRVGWVPKPAFDLNDRGELERLGPESRPRGLLEAIADRSRIAEALRRVENRLSLRRPIGHRWRLNRKIFEEIRAESERLGARLLVVYVPAKGLEKRPTPVFESEFADLGIPFLDLRSRLPRNYGDLYFEHDRHFNERGQAFAANEIAAALVELGWVDG